MGEGRKKGGSGGGNPLNYKVVGNPQPANPKPNTIWVDTDVKITGHYFRVEQPENMTEGEVWFGTGTSSPGSFNALKKNNITVYPSSAKQMVSGTLVDVKAKSWKDGAWAEWYTYLLKSGVDATEITGGWKGYTATAPNTGYVVAPTVEFIDGLLYFHFHESAGRYGLGATQKMIDLSNVTTLYFKVVGASDYFPAQVGAWTTSGNIATLVAGKTDVIGECEVVVDVSSLIGSYYIGALIGLAGNSSKATASIYLKDIYWE